MNPAIVIPSYWARDDRPTNIGEIGTYDHVTPVDKPLPELETCLSSLDKVRGVLRTIILLVAPPDCEASARARVESICRMHPGLNPLIIGQAEGRVMRQSVNKAAPTLSAEAVSLRGYGAIRNMGLAVSAVLGHDVVVFLDDDEVVLDSDFLVKAIYGLGKLNRQGIPIQVKTGYFLDRDDSPYVDMSKLRWCDRPWSIGAEFNQLMERMLDGTRIKRASSLCGGCFAVSAQAYTRVPFDSFITRGEDLDYLFDLRMHGIDVWFDNEWCVRHLPPETPSRASRFQQDLYRWAYEQKKLEVCNRKIGLRPVTPNSLQPYPAPWLMPEFDKRASRTALRRALVGPERLEYLKLLTSGREQAHDWATRSSQRYLSLLTYWSRIMDDLWANEWVAKRIRAMGTARLTWHGAAKEKA